MGTLARDGLMLTSIMHDLLQNAEKHKIMTRACTKYVSPFKPNVQFLNLLRRSENQSFLTFSRGIEIEYWNKIVWEHWSLGMRTLTRNKLIWSLWSICDIYPLSKDRHILHHTSHVNIHHLVAVSMVP